MSAIQKAMLMLIETFHKYSGKEGDKHTLTKAELTQLFKAELGESPRDSGKGEWDKIFKDLDADGDGTVNFQEYVTLVSCLTMCCNEFFQQE